MATARMKAANAPQEEYDAPIPADFLCPITSVLMQNPVVTAKGQTYEGTYIRRWFATHSKEPITGVQLTPSERAIFIPNYTVISMIKEWQTAHRIPAPASSMENKSDHTAMVDPSTSSTATAPPVPIPATTGATSASSTPVRLRANTVPELIAGYHPRQGSVPPQPLDIEMKDASSPVAASYDYFGLQSLSQFLPELEAQGEEPESKESKSSQPPLSYQFFDFGTGQSNEVKQASPATVQSAQAAFFLEVLQGSVERAKFFLSHGADKNARTVPGGRTALIIATRAEDKAMMRFLCNEAKVDVNAFDSKGNTALFYALQNDEPWFTRFLLRKGALEWFYTKDGLSLNEIGEARFGVVSWNSKIDLARSTANSFTLFRATSSAAAPAAAAPGAATPAPASLRLESKGAGAAPNSLRRG